MSSPNFQQQVNAWVTCCVSRYYVHGSTRIYVVRMAQFVLRTAKLSHIKGESQDLRSPSLIMSPAPDPLYDLTKNSILYLRSDPLINTYPVSDLPHTVQTGC